MKKTTSTDCLVHRVFVDGAGSGPGGTGSGYAFFDETTGKKGVKRVDGLTNNEAEYRGLLFAVCNMSEGGEADIISDSQLMVAQYNGRWRVREPRLRDLLERIRRVISRRKLRIRLTWIPREQNLAGRLLEK